MKTCPDCVLCSTTQKPSTWPIVGAECRRCGHMVCVASEPGHIQPLLGVL